jgi:tRNA(Ile)-lysidine synthase
VIVIHVDHGLSPDSARVAAEVTAWARARGVATVVRNVVVKSRASIEAAARDARYEALEAVAEEVGCAWVLLGHTARDQSETVMMRIVRGTGPAGLAGIPVVRGRFVRPLLEVPRAAIDAYVAAHALPCWDDPMNSDPSITRVRFRDVHMPALRAENPALDDALCRLAHSARDWMAAIDDTAKRHATFPMDCSTLLGLAYAIRKRAYALALERAGLSYDAAHLDAIDALVLRQADGQVGIDVSGGRVVRTYDSLDLERVAAGQAELVVPDGYRARTWQPGDRMKPARLKGRSRKLSDLYIDAKVPRDLRQAARVLVRADDGVIVWAEHVGLAHGESESLVPLPNRRGEVF